MRNSANRILGGLWNTGHGPYCYQQANVAECYVAYVENFVLWMFRGSTGGYCQVHPGGYCTLV